MGSTGRANGSVAAKATASAARTGAADGNPPACPSSVALPPPDTPPQRTDRVSVPFARCPAAPTWHGEPGFAFRNGTPGTPAFFFSHPDECGVSAVTHFQTVTRPERSLSFEFRTRGSLEAATSIRARRRTSPGTARHSRCQVTAGRSSPVFFWDTPLSSAKRRGQSADSLRSRFLECFSPFVTSWTAPSASGWDEHRRSGFAPEDSTCLGKAHTTTRPSN